MATYLEQIKQNNPDAYNKIANLAQYTANENFGGNIQDYQAQIFTPLDTEKAGIPKKLDFKPTYRVTFNEDEYTTAGGEPIDPNVTKSVDADSNEVTYKSSQPFNINGLPVYANYDSKGNLTGYQGDPKVVTWLDGSHYARGNWDAQGNPSPITIKTQGGGFIDKSDLGALAGLALSYFGAPIVADALGVGGAFSAESPFLSGMAEENAISGAGVAGASGGSYGAGAAAGAANAVPLVNPTNITPLSQVGTNPYSVNANYAPPTAPGGEGLFGGNTANIADMGGGQGITGVSPTGTVLGATGGVQPFSTLGSTIGTTGLAAGTGSLLGSGAASSGTAALNAGITTIPTSTPTVTPTVTPAGTSLPTDIATKVGTGVATGLLTSTLTGGGTGINPNLVQGGLQTAGGLLQSQASKDAALKAQQDILAATQKATTGAQFRPVGITTNFGSSQFQIDPATGQLVSAGYTANPAITSAENQLMKLGSSYLAQTPEQVAQQYLSKQYELLDPSRQRQLAAIRNQNFQTGRGGLSVGSTGLRPSGAQGLMGTNPELEAYYNALAQQDAQLAAQAQLAGQQQVTYGAGLFGQAGNLESLAQQPFTLGTGLGTSISNAGARAGELGLKGAGTGAIISTGADATRNPYATLLGAVGGPTSTLGAGLNKYLTDYLATNKASDIFDTSKYGTGLEGFQKALDDIYG